MRPYEEPNETRAARQKATALEQEYQLAIDNGLISLAETRDGRAYLRWLFRITKVGQQPFTGTNETTNFNCGELNIGNQILAHLFRTAPNTYLKLKQEEDEDNGRRNQQRDQNRNSARDSRNNDGGNTASYD